jgi:hypothetical protein
VNGDGIWLRFESGLDIEAPAITRTEILVEVTRLTAPQPLLPRYP